MLASSPARAERKITGSCGSARLGAQSAQQAEPVEARHHHVGQDQVRRIGLRGRERLLAVIDREHAVAGCSSRRM